MAGTKQDKSWVLVKGFNLNYHNKETVLFTIDPHYDNLNQTPQPEPRIQLMHQLEATPARFSKPEGS